MKKTLEKLLEIKGSSKNLAYELIDAGMPYDEEDADKLAALIRKWKQDKIPKKWEKYIKKVAENLGIQGLDEKDKKLLECAFINFLKDIKISYYEDEDKNIERKKALIFLIFMLILDKEFISESIEKEWGSLIELEENK
ncbi:hypothetical protein JCM11957_05090 [Caminibacter profundus]